MMRMSSNIQVIYLRLKSVGEMQLDFDLNLLTIFWTRSECDVLELDFL